MEAKSISCQEFGNNISVTEKHTTSYTIVAHDSRPAAAASANFFPSPFCVYHLGSGEVPPSS
jgi:hypothetical protein